MNHTCPVHGHGCKHLGGHIDCVNRLVRDATQAAELVDPLDALAEDIQELQARGALAEPYAIVDVLERLTGIVRELRDRRVSYPAPLDNRHIERQLRELENPGGR